MSLPIFRPNYNQRQWLQNERRTSIFIRAFWSAASQSQRRDPKFVWLITATAWTNIRPDGSGEESTRNWRNHMLAEYLKVDYQGISGLAQAVREAFPKLTSVRTRSLLYSYTGITHYYRPLRSCTRKYVLRHSKEIHNLFNTVSSSHLSPDDKIRKVATHLENMPFISIPGGGRISPYNPLTPVLACLDPHSRFPIMNQRTRILLRSINRQQDKDGAVELVKLIGTRRIHDSFELDVYSQMLKGGICQAPKRTPNKPRTSPPASRPLSIRSEIASYANLAAKRIRITHEHNRLIKQFKSAVFADIDPRESNYDILVNNWRRDRNLLIEAKTDWKGSAGRMQIRQAIGQLFDYRLQHYPEEINRVDLAVLLPTEPSSDIKDLLASLKIAILWFKANRLHGSIHL